MLTKRKTIAIFILTFIVMLFFGCLFLTACSENNTNESNGTETNNQSVSSEEKDDNGIKHHEIDLSMKNFSEFIKYTVTETTANAANKTGNHYEIQGVLRFAYYKNVILTLSATYKAPSWGGGEQKTFQFSVTLNAAGDFKFDTNNPIALQKLGWSSYQPGTVSQIDVIDVSGKVIFAI